MRGWLATGPVVTLLFFAAGEAAAAIAIDHSAVSCIVAAQYPRFEARFDPAAEVSRARLHFRPAGSPHWYSVSMKPEGGVFAGVLPKPKKSLRQIEYYIEATDTAFGSSRTSEYRPDVASGPAACQDKVMAGALPTASVLIEGPAGAPLVPVGFDPAGVVYASAAPGSGGTSGGSTGATGTGATGTAAAPGATAAVGTGGGGGIGTTGLVIGGVVAAGAGIGIAVAGGGDSSPASSGSSSGAGGTSGGGGTTTPCTPGPVTASLTNIATATRCGQRFSNGIAVSNGSCAAITILSIQLTQNAAPGPFCSALVTQSSYVPAVTTVAAGQTATVFNFQSNTFCCAAGPCPGTTTCGYDETFVVQTSAGALAAGTIPLQVSFDSTCPPCL